MGGVHNFERIVTTVHVGTVTFLGQPTRNTPRHLARVSQWQAHLLKMQSASRLGRRFPTFNGFNFSSTGAQSKTDEQPERDLSRDPSHQQQQAKEEESMQCAVDVTFLDVAQRRGVAGMCACLLTQVNDGSVHQQWSKTFLKLVTVQLLQLPESHVEALEPILSANQQHHSSVLEEKATARTPGSTSRDTTVHQVDAKPFVALVLSHDASHHQQENQTDDSDEDMDEQELSGIKELLLDRMIWFVVKTMGYDARARVLFHLLAKSLDLPWHQVTREEVRIGRTLFAEATGIPMEKVQAKRSLWDWKRNATIGAAAVTGGALLALTGGLAAPAIAASLTALGGAGAAIGTVVGSASGITATTVLFGTAGAGVVGVKTDNRTRGVCDFQFDLVSAGDGMNVYVCVSGWIDEEDVCPKTFRRSWGDSREYLRAFYRHRNPEKVDQVDQVLGRYKGREDEFFGILRDTYKIHHGSRDTDPLGLEHIKANDEFRNNLSQAEANELERAWRWRDRFPQGDQYVLHWEQDLLIRFGKSMRAFAKEQVLAYANDEIIKLTAFAALFAAVAIPRTLLKLTGIIDHAWALVMARSEESGKLLAEALSHREHGLRPVTLIGYGMGARLIYFCLKELAAKGDSCCGIVEHAVLLGSPIPVDRDEWQQVRRVVAGRLINGYSENDWMMALMYRYQGWSLNSAGIGPIDVAGVENVDLSDLIAGHLEYKNKIGAILDLLKLES